LEIKGDSEHLSELLAANKKHLDEIILDFLPRRSDSQEIQNLYDMLRDYPSRGGKGIRGTMCLLWCELFSGSQNQALLTAASLELFQNWILIHDDIEDQSDLRRGQPALHKKYGIELSINAGDALHGKMWELLISNSHKIGPQATLSVLAEFAKMLNETTEGQQIELNWTRSSNWEISEDDYMLMVTKKSAWYTCISPSRLGVILSSSNDQSSSLSAEMTTVLLEKLVTIGTNFGIAFQIIDDVLNLTADETKYGKEILGDLFEGKRTLMLIHLLNSLDPDAKKKVITSLSKSREEKSTEEMKAIFAMMKVSGSVDYARNTAEVHSKKAMKLFEETLVGQAGSRPEIYDQTKKLLHYLSSRDY
jgi:geranylgeranyl diphosphate synthase type II